jgi:ABC-2 type transport system ATP-binding protein
MSPAIEAKNVVKRYGSSLAVDGVSLTAPTGGIFALLGENGAGKSTLIRMLLGLTDPDEGEIRVLGLDARTQGDAIRRRVGYVSDRTPLYEWMTAAEIGWFTAGFYPPGFEESYREHLAQYGVNPACKISQMSKGTRSKVVLSLAVAHDPAVLILDEPTSGLDMLVRRQFLESIVDLATAGKTILLASHHIAEVERVADIVAIMRSGRLVLTQDLDELKQSTRELTVTTRGSAPPPRIRGEVLRSRRRARQWQVLVHAGSENDVARLHDDPLVVAIDERTPSLEEIYIAFMQARDSTQDDVVETDAQEGPLTYPRVPKLD